MYGLYNFGVMIHDEIRTNSFHQALKECIDSNSIVLDIGCGTGIFSLMASKLGAKHVYALEPQENAFEVAKKVVEKNCPKKNITIIRDLSTNITLDELADVIVADVHGSLPYYNGSVATLIDARDRLLKPGGVMMPERDVVSASVVNFPKAYRELSDPWGSDVYGFDFSDHRDMVVNELRRANFSETNLLSDCVECVDLDYKTINSTHMQSSIKLHIEKDGVAHGLGLWFDCHLNQHIKISNSPEREPLVYGQAFLPFERAMDLERGAEVKVDFKCNSVGGNYLWSWSTHIRDLAGNTTEFDQSTFKAEPNLNLKSLRKLAENYCPALSGRGKVIRSVMAKMNGEASLDKIAIEILAEHSEDVKSYGEAMELVRQLSQEHSV